MEALTGYQEKLIELSREVVNHGWGKCVVHVESLKDESIKIVVKCGKDWVFFVKKEIKFEDMKNIF